MEGELSTKKQIEKQLELHGYAYNIPKGSARFSSGDGDLIESAPLGYYRFHFWNGASPREHTNYIAYDKTLGHICVSLAEEAHGKRQYYRLLMRTDLGSKSCIVTQDAVAALDTKETNKAVVGIGLSNYIFSEKKKMAEFGEDGELDEARSLFSVSGVSIRSSMSARTRFLPHARFRELDTAPKIDVLALHPALLNTKLRLNEADEEGAGERFALSGKKSGSVSVSGMAALREIPLKKIVSRLENIKAASFKKALLFLDDAFFTSTYEFDVFSTCEETDETWRLFCDVLGKKKTPAIKKPRGPASTRYTDSAQTQAQLLAELFETEKSYLRRLEIVSKWYVPELEKELARKGAVWHRKVFSGINTVYQNTASLVAELTELDRNGGLSPENVCLALVHHLKEDSYSRYINSVIGEKKNIEKIEKEETVQLLNKRQQSSGLSLSDLLIEPVQRITRYKLLLDLLHRHTPAKEKRHVERALKHTQEIIGTIEERDRELAGFSELFHIVHSVEGVPVDILDGRRQVLYSCETSRVGPLGEKRNALLVLLTDYLLLIDTRKTQKIIVLAETLSSHCRYMEQAGELTPARLFVEIDPAKTRCTTEKGDETPSPDFFILEKKKETFDVFMEVFQKSKDSLVSATEKRTRKIRNATLHFSLNPLEKTKTPIPIVFARRVDKELFRKYNTDALAIVQGTENSIRFTVRSRSETYCSGEYCKLPEGFVGPEEDSVSLFFDALFNYRRLHSLYPPFSRGQAAKMKKMLGEIVGPFLGTKNTLFKKLKSKIAPTNYSLPGTDKNTLWRNMDETETLRQELIQKMTLSLAPLSQEALLVEMVCYVALYLENAVFDLPTIYIAKEKDTHGQELYRKTVGGKKNNSLPSLGGMTPDGLASFVLLAVKAISFSLLPTNTIESIAQKKILHTTPQMSSLLVFLFGHFSRMSAQNGIDTEMLSETLLLCLFENEKSKKTSERYRAVKKNRVVLLQTIGAAIKEPERIFRDPRAR
ncbi:MAG: uncharacterized protein A8A55_2033 [Amphiamblys sp. WSBS2006]|nr:MAG: uncharacterized protein A8A55_2033 [Amphiamblys sp. WSBS2006]